MAFSGERLLCSHLKAFCRGGTIYYCVLFAPFSYPYTHSLIPIPVALQSGHQNTAIYLQCVVWSSEVPPGLSFSLGKINLDMETIDTWRTNLNQLKRSTDGWFVFPHRGRWNLSFCHNHTSSPFMASVFLIEAFRAPVFMIQAFIAPVFLIEAFVSHYSPLLAAVAERPPSGGRHRPRTGENRPKSGSRSLTNGQSVSASRSMSSQSNGWVGVSIHAIDSLCIQPEHYHPFLKEHLLNHMSPSLWGTRVQAESLLMTHPGKHWA